MKQISWFWLVVLLGVFSACDDDGNTPVTDTDDEIDWVVNADKAIEDFVATYWNSYAGYFNYNNLGSTEFHYWPQAHSLDALLDAYERTNSNFYLTYINNWFDGVRIKNGNTWINDYYDDMEWNALAMLRAFEITGDQKFKDAVDVLWEDIKTGWNDYAGGGLMWFKETPNGKNAISNSPASILASRLYQIDQDPGDLEWAQKIYTWVKTNLIDLSTGAVWDHVIDNDGVLSIKKDWIFTYNQGVYLGAALELYEITGQSGYLNDAQKAADYTVNSLSTTERLLKDEGDGDGGLFKGIFVRYFTQLILNKNVSQNIRNRYSIFLEHNAKTLWTEGRNDKANLFNSNWNTKPGSTVDLTVQLSGIMLLEAAALLQTEGIINNE